MWLLASNENWGPKPFKFINGWLQHENGKEFIEEKWKGLEVEGWKAHVVKEKLKYVKEKLKVWNKEVYGIQDIHIERVVKELNAMEEEGGVEKEWDATKRRRLNAEFWDSVHRKESLIVQKARARWIQQGDRNTKYFHNSVKVRQRRNQIEMIRAGDRWLSGVEEIKEEVRRHFSCQFKEEKCVRPTLDGVHFKSISSLDSDRLIEEFTMEEVKEAVWICEGDKSPRPDGFNFTFIKSCWETIKEEIFGVLVQIHANGKVPRAFKSSFVALIGKKENPQR